MTWKVKYRIKVILYKEQRQIVCVSVCSCVYICKDTSSWENGMILKRLALERRKGLFFSCIRKEEGNRYICHFSVKKFLIFQSKGYYISLWSRKDHVLRIKGETVKLEFWELGRLLWKMGGGGSWLEKHRKILYRV